MTPSVRGCRIEASSRLRTSCSVDAGILEPLDRLHPEGHRGAARRSRYRTKIAKRRSNLEGMNVSVCV